MNKLVGVDWSTIPAPEDDGGTDHLRGMQLPAVKLLATNGESIDLSTYAGLLIVYAYPMTGVPGTPLPEGWITCLVLEVVRRNLVHFVIMQMN